MRTSRAVALCWIAAAAFLVAGCTGNHSADEEAAVVLSAAITEGPAEQPVDSPADVIIGSMTIRSQAKSPDFVLSQQQDVLLTEWVITPIRSDGGTVASPEFRNYYSVFISAGSSATVQNYRIFPASYYTEPPLNQLFPWNGGLDKETGKPEIRQRLHIDVYGKTVSGKNVVLRFDVDIRFFYSGIAG
jgi:hypothetical protein